MSEIGKDNKKVLHRSLLQSATFLSDKSWQLYPTTVIERLREDKKGGLLSIIRVC